MSAEYGAHRPPVRYFTAAGLVGTLYGALPATLSAASSRTSCAALLHWLNDNSHQAFMNGLSYRPNKAPAHVVRTGNTTAS